MNQFKEHRLYIDDCDSCLTFKTWIQAHSFAKASNRNFIIISIGEFRTQAFNTFLTKRRVEYLKSENESLRYVGSFI